VAYEPVHKPTSIQLLRAVASRSFPARVSFHVISTRSFICIG
jgi:hypothetical protein